MVTGVEREPTGEPGSESQGRSELTSRDSGVGCSLAVCLSLTDQRGQLEDRRDRPPVKGTDSGSYESSRFALPLGWLDPCPLPLPLPVLLPVLLPVRVKPAAASLSRWEVRGHILPELFLELPRGLPARSPYVVDGVWGNEQTAELVRDGGVGEREARVEFKDRVMELLPLPAERRLLEEPVLPTDGRQ